MKLYQKMHELKNKSPQIQLFQQCREYCTHLQVTTQRAKLSLVDTNNFSDTKFKSTFICIYVFINIAEQCVIILYNYIYFLYTKLQIPQFHKCFFIKSLFFCLFLLCFCFLYKKNVHNRNRSLLKIFLYLSFIP